jgi:hypothetical protein
LNLDNCDLAVISAGQEYRFDFTSIMNPIYTRTIKINSGNGVT